MHYDVTAQHHHSSLQAFTDEALSRHLRCDSETSLLHVNKPLSVAGPSMHHLASQQLSPRALILPRVPTKDISTIDKYRSEQLRKSAWDFKFRTKTPHALSKQTTFINKDVSKPRHVGQRDDRGNLATCLGSCPRIYWSNYQILPRTKSNLRHPFLTLSMAPTGCLKYLSVHTKMNFIVLSLYKPNR
jgi:hypothetical protein